MRKNIFTLVFGLLVSAHFLHANELCGDRLFTISTSSQDGVAVGDLLSQLAAECGYSMLVQDRAAKDKLSKSIASVNVRQLPIEKIFDLILTENELNYEFNGNLLKVSFLITETFQINYIGTSRIGASNTDIVLSQNAMTSDSSTTSNTGGTGTTGGGLNSASTTTDIQNSVHSSLTSNGLQSGKVDSISGTKILSMDQFDFWGRLEKEIFEIAFRPGDAHQPKRIFSNSQDQQDAQDSNQAQGYDIGDGQSVVVNKIAGLVTVTGTVKQLDRVRKYIKNLEDQIQNQVMIDVNILTVTHTNSNTVGVDWNQFWNFGNLLVPAYASGNEDNTRIDIGGGGTSINIFSSGVQMTRIVEFLNAYGKVRSVSNPKVLTLSNQPALISVGSILRYAQSSVFQNSSSGGTTQNTSTSFPSVFSGVLLDVTPSVQGEYIMLKINPSITQTKDRNTENAATALSEPPNLSSNQLSSLVRAKDGDRVVLGGLISKSVSNNTNRVPILGYIPLLKYLFSYDGTSEQTTEMIIIITPHIIKRSDDNPSLQDLGYSEVVNRIVETNDATAGLEESKELDRKKDF
ncbi:pilus (MSHA type) biogenesis protein MshL [Helicobacter sp. MIT 99-5507]|uniref:pilus (MSHA type) biogenesis protein MshL n=1 Tax=Helicobacter sp. MIT 99-5507 TaxID=152489 RepID=UPI000E1F4186|nr:pilus (MSHA type) biogenesis protein MshL [Helicobacter sp. MIT 99-5507]RDU57447.1 pilus (MSHA type) biogenesis protein MshL [Helicobacter sp. MIT 99-5507]